MRNLTSKKTIRTLVVTMLLVGAAAVSAKQLGGQTGWMLRMGGVSADRIALGDAGVALVEFGQNWYYNPAAISFQQSRTAALGYRAMSLDRSIMYVGGAFPIEPNAGLGVGLMRAGTDNVEAYDSNGRRYDTFSWADNLIYGSFSLRPHPAVGLGITIKWLISTVPDVKENHKNLNSFGLSVDLGVRVQPSKDFSIGLHIKDFDGRNTFETSDVWGDDAGAKEDKLPTQIRVGAAWEGIEHLTLVGDVTLFPTVIADDKNGLQPHVGGQFLQPFAEDMWAAFRAGINNAEPTFGLGLSWKVQRVRMTLSYAFLFDANSPGSTQITAFEFEF